MNSLQYTSIQGVLDSIIRNYLLNELPPEGERNNITRHNIAERDIGLSQLAASLHNFQTSLAPGVGELGPSPNINAIPKIPGTIGGGDATKSAQEIPNTANIDQEYVNALHKCFEKRGIFRELQTFLRVKLVSILQDEWPNLQHVNGSETEPKNTIIFRLIEDFLRCHKLLYTLSVLASEADAYYSSIEYGKLTCQDAEDLLYEMGIKRNSRLSGQILKCYFDKDNFSLLESMHYLGMWLDTPLTPLDNMHIMQEPNSDSNLKKKGSNNRQNENAEQRLLELERKMERDQEERIKSAIEKSKVEEEAKILQEAEAKHKLQLIEKDKSHFLEMEKRIHEINVERHRERQEWFEAKTKQENELFEVRKQVHDTSNAMTILQQKHSLHTHSDKVKLNTTLSKSDTQKSSKIAAHNQLKLPACSEEKQILEGETSPVLIHYVCDCKKNAFPSHSEFQGTSWREESSNAFPRHNLSTVSLESIRQDKIAFLQYRIEKQDEQIKALQRELLLSSPNVPLPQRSAELNKVHESKLHQPNQDKPDHIDNFIAESKERIGKLDNAASKIDDIVQQLFVNKNRTVLASSKLAARISATEQRKNRVSSQIQPSSVCVPSNSLFPIVGSSEYHQQLPERPVTFVSSVLKNLPAFNFDIYNDSLYGNHAAPASISIQAKDAHEAKANENRPSTPENRIFPVAYGTQKISPSIKTQTANDVQTHEKSLPNVIETEPEESLFHMAVVAKHIESKMQQNHEKKALRHGALSREKVMSPDEVDNSECHSRNISVADSIKVPLANTSGSSSNYKRKPQNPTKDDGVSSEKNTIDKPTRALTKATLNGKHYQENSNFIVPETEERNAVNPPCSEYKKSKSSSSPDSISPPKKDKIVSRSPENDLSSRSLSISVPRSSGDEEEDFWKI